MYWENIEGMGFTFNLLYSNMVNKFDNAVFAEIGVWKGQSAVYMAEQIKKSGKNIKFWAIDSFCGDGEENEYNNDPDVQSKTILQKYYENIEPVKNYINTIPENSLVAHKYFENESIDFLFIDGDHRYEGVKQDLKLWMPKIKKGGVIAGHDYNEPTCGVKQAVDEFFLFGAQGYAGGCWIFYKK
jgi:cephalosporin hydroxylase